MAFDDFLKKIIPDDRVRGVVESFLSGGEDDSGKSSGPAARVEQMKNAGLGEQTKSWVGTGPNKQLTAEELRGVIDQADLKKIAQKAGMSEQEMLEALADHLPNVVDKATPSGNMGDLRNMSGMPRGSSQGRSSDMP
jgi:uncharacterized protein YidB (DUF937 family)